MKTFYLSPFTTYYYKIKIDPDNKNFRIVLNSHYNDGLVPKIELGYHFFNNPNNSDITNRSNYQNEHYISSDFHSYEFRIYELENNNKYQYLGICIDNQNSEVQKIDIIIQISKLPDWVIALIVIACIIITILLVCRMICREGRGFCASLPTF